MLPLILYRVELVHVVLSYYLQYHALFFISGLLYCFSLGCGKLLY